MGERVLRDALLVLAAAPIVYYLLAIVAAKRFFRASTSASPSRDFAPPVSILKPIRGLDRETYQNYASFCAQDYPEFEILFCVSDERDPAVPIIERVIRDFTKPGAAQHSIRLLIGSDPLGASDKVNKLCRMAKESRYDVILVSDSDVRVDPDFLHKTISPLRDPKVGGVTCLYRGLTDGSFAANLEALGNSTDFAAGVITSWVFADVDFMLGAVMCTTRRFLAEIGGFESLADYFCDDFELGNRIAAKGYRIELSRFPVSIVYPRQTFAQTFRHQLRWNLSIRYSRPLGHFGLIFAQGFPWAVLAALIAPSRLIAVCYLAAYVACRLVMALLVGWKGMRDPLVLKKDWMLVTRDVFAFVVWLVSFFPQKIHWRDQEFYVREKRLVPVPARPARS